MAEKAKKMRFCFKVESIRVLPTRKCGEIVRERGFDRHFLPILENSSIRVVDKLRTVTEHIVYQITETLNRVQAETVLLRAELLSVFDRVVTEKFQKEIILPDNETINFKESIVFAFLGLLRWRNEINSLKSVTVRTDNCGGAIYSLLQNNIS